jgi:hypothetical protein
MDAHWMKAKPETLELPEPCHLSLSLFLGLRCIACVVLPGGTNRHLSPSASVTHLLKSKKEEEEKHKRPTNGLEKTGVVGRVFVQA